MNDDIFSNRAVWLIGRAFDGLAIDEGEVARLGHATVPPAGRKDQGEAVRLARIYAFTLGGHYVALARPAVFLVRGEGQKLSDPAVAAGLVVKPQEFADSGALAWAADRDDMTLRLDIETGSVAELLVAPEVGGGLAAGQNVGQNIGQNIGQNVGQNVGLRGRGAS
ncbi:MAG: hypothetical protein KDG89_06025 [Geminicoccaceae bacterium]|nr:hypothetical protein [Geminicoccaceae bacterium]